MSLYDDFDTFKQKTDQVAGWSSGIKLFQSQLQLKKATPTQPKRDITRKTTIAPVFDLKNKKDDELNNSPLLSSGFSHSNSKDSKNINFACTGEPQARDMDWNFEGNEYNPLWPNDYDKVVKDLREIRDREREREDEERRKRREERARNRDRAENDDRRKSRKNSDTEEEDESDRAPRGGVAIAPPPMLQDASSLDMTPRSSGGPSGASVAAKIMAKYGFKEGQGLGKKEQGMSMALQVEKTSKRGGRIIHEKEIMPPPSMELPPKPNLSASPPSSVQQEELKNDPASITELMKAPSKVVLLKNMVGPGEVDQDLEPEVKDECNTKYGDVIKVLIHELPDGEQEEAVKIFVEFKRIESAIKAVVDLNGRFFGGRQVKAGFYNQEKFATFRLLE